MEDLINELKLSLYGRRISNRLRFAVTVNEYKAFKAYFAARNELFYARLLNIPLLVEDDPENPPLTME